MHLHVVSFNVPWPADYGGVIDVYYRIKKLADQGVKIHLHCYTYGREEAKELEELCEEVCYYRRETGMRHQWERRPYIVASRNSIQLIERLKQDEYPILLEGLHNCYVLEQLGDGKRKIAVRAHNVEHDYYQSLAQAEKNLWKKFFFWLESRKLKRYESILVQATTVLTISEKDAQHFRAIGCKQVVVVPPSHSHSQVSSQTGRGEYVLYQGNLSVAENVSAVEYIAKNLIANSKHSFVIAGRNPSLELQKRLTQYQNLILQANPTDEEMHALVANAHVNVLVTDQATGVKLKLMNALYEGRFCLVNSTMVQGTELGEACVIADNPAAMLNALDRLMDVEFTEKELARRKEILARADTFDNFKNILL